MGPDRRRLAFITAAFGVVQNAWKKEPKPAEGHSDAVVISGAFADAQPVRELTQAVRDMTQAARDQRDATRDFDRSQADRSRDLVEVMRDVRNEAKGTNEKLGAIQELIVRGVRIAPAPPED